MRAHQLGVTSVRIAAYCTVGRHRPPAHRLARARMDGEFVGHDEPTLIELHAGGGEV
jgi:hypothetical protein